MAIPYKFFIPDFSAYDRVYQDFDTSFNDIDIAFKNANMRGIIDSLLTDQSVPQSPSLSDDQLFDSFIGKEMEPDEIVSYMHSLEKDFKDD